MKSRPLARVLPVAVCWFAALGWVVEPTHHAARPRPLAGPAPQCAGRAPASLDTAIAEGRWWHASLLLRRLPPGRGALPAGDVLQRARVAEGLERWTIVDSLLRRVKGGDTIPAYLAMAARADEHAGRWGAAAQRYRRLGTMPDVDEVTRDAAAARLGLVYEKLHQPDSASAAWRRAAQAVPELADWFAIHRADHDADTALAFATLALTRSPGARKWAEGVIAARRLAAGNLVGALQEYQRLGQPLAAARVLDQLGRRAAARALADSVLFTPPAQPPTPLLAAQFVSERYDPLTLREAIAISRAYRVRGARGAAERFARAATRVRPDTSVAAWLELASVLASRREGHGALRALDSAGVRAGPAGAPLIGAARVAVLLSTGEEGQADDLLGRLAAADPGDSSVARAELAFANHDRARLQLPDELRRYTELLGRFAATPAANLARFRLGLVFYAAGARDSARALIEAAARRDTALALGVGPRYWQARVRFEAGDSAGAADLRRIAATMPVTYYGVRARMLLRDTAFVVDTNLAPAPAGSYPPSRARERVLLLARLGFEAEARAEAAGWLGDSAAGVPVLLAAAGAAADAGYATESIWLGEAARRRAGMIAPVARALFPMPFASVIDGEAAEQCMDPLLLAAIIRQESRFNPHAVSAAGARGIAQVMPATGRWYARRLRIPDWNPGLLFVPDHNLHIGTRFLLDRVTADSFPVYAMLAAYNAGASRVRTWRTWPEFSDPDLFAERVAISQTNDYVKTVYMSYVWYRRLYGPVEAAGGLPSSRPLAPYF